MKTLLEYINEGLFGGSKNKAPIFNKTMSELQIGDTVTVLRYSLANDIKNGHRDCDFQTVKLENVRPDEYCWVWDTPGGYTAREEFDDAFDNNESVYVDKDEDGWVAKVDSGETWVIIISTDKLFVERIRKQLDTMDWVRDWNDLFGKKNKLMRKELHELKKLRNSRHKYF